MSRLIYIYIYIYMGQDMMKVPYGRDNQNQANVTSAKYYMFRSFPENLLLFAFLHLFSPS